MNQIKPYHSMQQTMRWFGPGDPVSLADLKQSGCTGVVSALHHIPNGEVWTISEISKRKKEIESAGMVWLVVESLPVSESIKTMSGDFQHHIKNYQESIRNLAGCGINTITYNFMPVLDWVRTDLQYIFRDGSTCLRFERAALIAFDIFILKRKNADVSYSAKEVESAKKLFQNMPETKKQTLQENIIAGLPGSEEKYTISQLTDAVSMYDNIKPDQLRANLLAFLKEIIPIAKEAGAYMVIHPDDPPYSVLGLPRVVSNKSDLETIFKTIPDINNGFCFCSGSLASSPGNDLIDILKTFGSRIHFIHLRNVTKNDEGDFFEDNHLEGDVDMYKVTKELVMIMKDRNLSIPMRPDHGHQMLDDLKKTTNPGYSIIGRLRGLAELRGLEMGIICSLKDSGLK